MRDSALVEVQHLTKLFGNFKAVDDVSFFVRASEIVGLLGPSGAGKTTTIHMMLGLISPTAGSVRIFGKRLEENREQILQKVSFTAPYVLFPTRLTVFENLLVFARLYRVNHPSSKIRELLRMFAIEHLKNKPVSRLSSGENTRVGLCKAFMSDPKLLLMDEPTAYLDPQLALHVKEILLNMQYRSGTTILYTSHNMAEVEEMCSRIIFLNRGRVLATGTPIEVTQTILKENRTEPALREVFLHLARRQPNEVA
ncbi:MAG TPA: ABC transporter ATP-binding protein [Chthoniobacterales bacterium]|nr:ABC transporter ATP-binding protein [Verrucomicrobiota bacterium]MBV8351091.1 ABC transporter ATP-binding protein [Verrucomicrobiota bacterium]HTD15701.1 ABC transporter ATP-binding protein [Chthoniobacterales bacterium]